MECVVVRVVWLCIRMGVVWAIDAVKILSSRTYDGMALIIVSKR